MTRFLCCSDLHIGAGAAMLPPGQRLNDHAQVLYQIVQIAYDRHVDAVLVAGDVFHRPRPTPEELHVARGFFRDIPVPVLAINGNAGHDLEGDGRRSALELFANHKVTVHAAPDTWMVGEAPIVASLPSVPLGLLLAAHPGMSREEAYQLAAELLMMEAARLRAEGAEILVAHWSVSGAVTATGMEVGPDFGVVLPLADLEAQGWDAVVLGHIHKAQMLETALGTARGPIFYCSSPLPLDFGEAANQHGCWILDVPGGGLPATATFVPIESRPLVTIDFDFTDVGDALPDIEVLIPPDARYQDGAIVRLRYTATEEQHRRVDHAAARRYLLDLGAAAVRIEPTVLRGTRARNAAVDTALAPLDAITEWATAQQLDEQTEPLRHLTRTYLEGASA